MSTSSTISPASIRRLVIAASIGAFFFLFGPNLVALIVEHAWFKSVGFSSVFSGVLKAKVITGAIIGLSTAAAVYLSSSIALRQSDGRPLTALRKVFHAISGFVERLPLLLSLAFGLLAGLLGSTSWETLLAYQYGGTFGQSDALFGHDVGFYVFTLPALRLLHGTLTSALVLALIGAALIYALRGGVFMQGDTPRLSPKARTHLFVLLGLYLLLHVFGTFLRTRELVFSETGPVMGASYADVNATLPALYLSMVVTALMAVLVFWAARTDGAKKAVLAVGVVFLTNLLAVSAYPSAVQRFGVLPNEAERETPFIERNIAATRAGYGLDSVVERDLNADSELTYADIEANRATIENVRLWDHQPLLDTFAQIQEIRTYYEFASVDNDRYIIDGELRQTMLSARELSSSSLPNRTWINEHFTFTHGYGLTLGPVNRATEEGLPELFIQDIPPESSTNLEVTRPEIYFGELTDSYVFVGTEAREFDYPRGDDNAYTSYEGSAGVPINSSFMKLLLSVYFESGKVLLSDDIGPGARLLLHRDVRQRVREIAPFLTYDSDPYLVVRDDGTLTWIMDAYTISNHFPYAERLRSFGSELNYIRNAVKVTIDAYDGTVHFYVNDDEPIVRMWRSAFPALFEDLDNMPEDLLAHLRHPEDLFRIQTAVFTVYHMESGQDVYDREDQWAIPSVEGDSGDTRMEPYYTVMRLPGESEEEFILMLPYTPKSKQNLAAWMVARSDGEHRGELVVYRFPKDRLVFGPSQIMNRINQDADISRQISLWDQRGSEAIFGTLLVIPVEESLIYVAPLYLRAGRGRIPELKRVIAVYGNNIAMEPTLDAALESVFEVSSGVSSETESAEVLPEHSIVDPSANQRSGEPLGPRMDAEDAQALREIYDDALAAQRAGDWARYGEAIELLGERLAELSSTPATQEVEAPPAELQEAF